MAQHSADSQGLHGMGTVRIGLEQLQLLLESIDGAVYQTEIGCDGVIRVTYASPSLFSVMKRDPQIVGAKGENVFDVILPEDLEPLQNAIREASQQNQTLNRAFRVCYEGGTVEWRHVHGVCLPEQEDGVLRMVDLVTNIDAYEQAKESLQEKERIVDFALRNTDINLWYFDCEKKECLQGENCQRAHEMPGEALMNNFPECLFEMGYVREDSMEPLRKAYRHLWETGENVEFDAWFRKADNSGWWCERDMLTAIKGPDGKVTRGIGIGKNVTAEKELEEKYQAFQDYRRLAEKNTVASLRMNLTKETLGDCVSEIEAVRRVCASGSMAAFFAYVVENAATEEDKVRCQALFTQKYLLEALSRGESFVSLEYRGRDWENRARWLRTSIEMMRNPATGDVEALLYSFNIDYEKSMASLVDRLLDADYEFLGLIDVDTEQLQVFGKYRNVEGMARNGEPYGQEIRRVFKNIISDEYYEESVRTMSFAHVVQALESREYYACSFPARDFAYTRAGRKQWKFEYLDSSKSQIFMTRTDITSVFTAEYDALTGLYNRQAFYRHVREVLDTHPEQKFALIRCDIDRFKAYNDVYGSQAGDQVLAKFGRAVRQNNWPGTAVFSRIEADHFCILYPLELLDPSVWSRTHSEWLGRAAQGYHLTSSMGIYEITDTSVEISLMCDRALLALQTVKDSYIVKMAWYDERLRKKLMDEQALADEMEHALRERQFILHFQPQVRCSDGAVVGAEALVRWSHPEHGLIPPGEFIPLFEKNGFIIKLDAYVWEESCACLRRRLDKGGPLAQLPVSVNISRCDLYDPALCEKLVALVEKYRLPLPLLRLEITESAYMDDPDQLIGVVNELRRLGFMVEMDDFGTGYSSLTMLKDVPVDMLKLDMKFLTQLENDRRGATILSAIIGLASSLDLPVIAEGVETAAQADFLKSLGCTEMQGYYFGRPVSETEFELRFGT